MDSSHLFNKTLNAEQMAIASLDFENSLFLFLFYIYSWVAGTNVASVFILLYEMISKDKSQQGENLVVLKATFLYQGHLKL